MTTSLSPAAPARHVPPLLMLMTLAIGFVMAMIDVTAVNTALSDIALSLAVPLTGLVWVVDGYTLTFAALLMAGGALADRYGPKAVYQGGLSVFILGSVLCALAPSGHALIAARLLQGAGAALFMPSSLSLLTHAYEDQATRARMLGTWSAIVGCSSAAGPLVGGLLVHAYGWRSVFWVNVPIGLLGIVLTQALAPATARHARALSLLSHALGVTALAALSFVLIEGPALGWLSPAVLAAALLALAAGALLVRRERAGAHPLLPKALFETAAFAAANGVGFLINFAVFGQLFLLSLFIQQGGADALQTGLRLIPMMAAFAIGNLTSGRITARVGTRPPMLYGLLVGLGMALLMLAGLRPATPYWQLVTAAVVMNVAIGIAIPGMTATVMLVAGKAHANSAAAALNANRQIGALVGVAMMGTVLHMAPAWGWRLPLSFGLIAAAYAAALGLVYCHVRPARPGGV
ncbi:DHA2 family methylenomycin A resistance protein-like MFS transporter [Duganella sp. 1224]|uniref:MFS transporter n=1 Tax=Duganella sp. 1224 TaxID=2587052 RepID=UPI0015CEE5F3|nr:MFS transporter [Duganella sp. 1224]NYE59278.1 DHA2 family methylenomycin A resistance protein-like MFS transporter [Duganella sp. 1224]